ncbi:cell division protein ZipA C-terminal FtsZ-binding domain-containing protein [Burkholderia sp. 22PA0106]|uniref:cell division protein ZipA C-terminal FtsZ-binding domain-containing protein n=1 Tax=Burkholderia sp. 22PA0106 TaxID=3237371 RepID=UPI0039C3698E
MDELTLGLVGAGVVVVGGVAIYNALQGAKVRRKMPRPMPSETADTLARQERDDDAPFIEPVRQPSARRDAAAPAAPAAPASAAPAAASAPAPAVDRAARVEPTFGSAPDASLPADVPADLQADETLTAAAGGTDSTPAEPHAGDTHAPHSGEAGTADAPVEPVFDADDEPVLPAATTISSAPPAIVDRRIDCIVPIRLAGPMPGERLMPAAQRLRRAGSKPVHIEGKPEGTDHWELLQGGVRYEELRAAVQLANRNGPLNELEFSEFVSGVGQFADAIDGGAEFPDMLETVQMARELDGFAAQCDAQLSINVMSDGAPWSANYVQAVASQDGLLLSRDGTRFVKLDARQNPVFMLQFGDTNFLRDDLTYKGSNMITLVLDVPVADEDILPFKLMCDYAKSLSDRIGARVVDDSRRPLPEATLVAIEQQLMKLYGRLEQAGIPAGSPVTRRLFSQ